MDKLRYVADHSSGRYTRDPAMTDDLTKWLVQIGLGEHAAKFALQGIDWDVLGDLSEDDLKELGLTLGDRKRFTKGLAALSGAHTPSPERAAGRPVPGSSPAAAAGSHRQPR